MKATCLRFVALLALLFATSCAWANVEPAPDLDLVHARSVRPALGFDLRSSGWAGEFDGENLAEQTAAFRAALEGTGTFGSITRTQAVDGLHCAFELHSKSGVFGGGIWFALTVGLIPDLAEDEYVLTATVSAPGRQSSTYRVQTSGKTFLWLPLLPVGLVQAAVRRGDLQQTVDALVTQMAKDGWLGR